MAFASDQPCRLLELPPELRLEIYQYVFPPKTIHIWVDKNVYRWRSYTWKAAVSLLSTCRRIAHEAAPVFHDNTTVHFSICDEFERPLSRYHRFSPLDALVANSFNHVRKIQLSLHTLTEPIFELLLDHVRGLLSRLHLCAGIRSLEMHFEFWSTISDADLYEIYDTLAEIGYNYPVEIGTLSTGSWTLLYYADCFSTCLKQIRDDIYCKRQGLPLFMRNEHVGAAVGPRDLIILSKG